MFMPSSMYSYSTREMMYINSGMVLSVAVGKKSSVAEHGEGTTQTTSICCIVSH